MRYLTEQEVIAINHFLIDRYSPGELKGTKEAGLLNSAVERAKQTVFGTDAYVDVFEKAAALFESLAKNHCFHNANKRTAFVCFVQFLAYNGYRLQMDVKAAEDLVVDMVVHRYDFQEIAETIRFHCKEKDC